MLVFRTIVVSGFLLVSWNTSAVLIENVFNVDPSSIMVRANLDNAGNEGEELVFLLSVNPFFVSAGDVIRTTVKFQEPLTFFDTVGGFWSSTSGNVSGSEPLNFTYFYTDGRSGIGSNADFSITSTITLDILGGSPTATSITRSANGGGAGITVFSSLSNLTNTRVTIGGFEIETSVANYQINRPDGEISLFQGAIQSGKFGFTAISEPSTLALMFLILGGVTCKRSKWIQ